MIIFSPLDFENTIRWLVIVILICSEADAWFVHLYLHARRTVVSSLLNSWLVTSKFCLFKNLFDDLSGRSSLDSASIVRLYSWLAELYPVSKPLGENHI